MTKLWKFTAAALGFVGVFATAEAQSLRSSDGPAEIPPASYSGNQYVDSNGCVFIRAGFGGNTTWVPRVNRQRQVVCGFRPTFAGNQPPPSTPAPAPSTNVATLPPPAATPPRTTVVATPPPRTVVPAPTPPRTTTVVRPPATVVAPPPATGNTGCTGVSPLAQKYMKSGTYSVRCGPQAASPYVRGDGSGVIVVPQPPALTPPPGYKAAWQDDRLNPNRGHVTREGFVQMRLVWTAGVPRRLVTEGKERYPVVNAVPNQYREYTVTSGKGIEVVSTKGVEPPRAVPPANGHRFVQVGAFDSEAKAQAAARGLQSRGLPVRLTQVRSGGRTYVMVLAGPFASPGALQSGLTTVQGIGYSGAFTRK